MYVEESQSEDEAFDFDMDGHSHVPPLSTLRYTRYTRYILR